VRSDIRVCSDPGDRHDRPVYTLGDDCPACGAPAVNSAPPPFSPADPYGAYRRRARRRAGDGDEDGDGDGNEDGDAPDGLTTR